MNLQVQKIASPFFGGYIINDVRPII